MAHATKDSLHSQMAHLQSKYVGTGHTDTTKYDWAVNIQRDSIASYIGHPSMLNYFATAMNESPARMRHNLLMRMISPCGPPPPSEEDSDSE
jgi:splicing factor 3B subunit 5